MTTDNARKYLAEQYPEEFSRWLLAIETNNGLLNLLYRDLSVNQVLSFGVR